MACPQDCLDGMKLEGTLKLGDGHAAALSLLQKYNSLSLSFKILAWHLGDDMSHPSSSNKHL